MGIDAKSDDTELDLFGIEVLIALEQKACEEPEQSEPEEDLRQLKFRFDAAML